MEATIQRLAAVVRPITLCSVFMMVPAPKNPMPTIMAAATRAGSAGSGKAWMERTVRMVEPRPTRM